MLALSRPHPTRHRRGLSLLEVVVVAAVASVIFLILLRWVLTMTAVSTITIDNANPARNAAYLDTRLAADIAAATTCDATSQTPIAHLDPTSFDMYTTGNRSDGTNGLKVIRWSATNNQITRAETNLIGDGSDCITYTPGTPKTIAAGATGTTYFQAQTGGTDDGTCSILNSYPQDTDQTGADACNPDTIKVNISLSTASDEAAPVTVQRSYPVAHYGTDQ